MEDQTIPELTPPDLTKPCGPNDLTKCLLNWRRNDRRHINKISHLEEEDIKDLISLAFYTSTIPEEGRYPKFRLFVFIYDGTGIEFRTLIKFDNPIKLREVKDIHRLTPAISMTNSALRIRKTDTGLCCDAIVLIDDSQVLQEVGEYRQVDFDPKGLMITVDGPGEIRVTESSFTPVTFQLRAGVIHIKRLYSTFRILEGWMCFLSTLFAFQEKNIESKIPSISEMNKMVRNFSASFYITSFLHNREIPVNVARDLGDVQYGIEYLIKISWGKVLQKVIDARHGGTFLILPEIFSTDEKLKANVLENFDLKLKYQTNNLSLGQDIVNYFNSCEKPYLLEHEKPPFNSRGWMMMKNILDFKVDALAKIANVDGCVVLDNMLNVIGFGGEILTSTEQANHSELKYAEYNESPEEPKILPEDQIEAFGTRNRSAFRFCKANPGSIMFVISQDGDLRVFASDSKYIYFLKDLTAEINPR